MTRDLTLEEIASVLEGAKIRNGELRAACPAHGGDNAGALSVTIRDGKLLATCHTRHCEFRDIVGAIRERLGEPRNEIHGEVVEITRSGKRLDRKPKNDAPQERKVWELRDATGKLIALHVRDETPQGKKVWWRLPSGKPGLGGRSTADLPLYGAQDVARTPAGSWVVVTEGEKAADALRTRALREAGMSAVGTVTGASGTPGPEALSLLRGRRVVLWPDNDTPGHEHMERIAEALKDVASEVRIFDWEDAPEKGDAADHPHPDELAPALKLAPRWSRPPAIPGRVLLGQAIEHGVEPPEELLPDMLLAGKAHNVYAPGGVGKTWLLVWIATELVKQGKRVVVFDLENGLRTYAERFEEMGANPRALDDLLHYYPFPAFDRATYERMLDEERPDCVMFDSWIGFLAADGRDENVSNDISAWADAYSKPALRRGSAVLVLDHVPHDHERERGSSRKRDEMDVVWKLTKVGDFDRDQTATLAMSKQKDREGWLPEKLTFEIGGDPEFGFVMRRDDSLARRVEVTHTTGEERKILDLIRDRAQGIKATEWQKLAKGQQVSRASFYRLLGSLKRKGKVVLHDGLYAVAETQHVVVSSGLNESHETDETTGGRGLVSEVSPPTGVVRTSETGAPPEAPASGFSSVPFIELSSEEKRRKFQENLARAYGERK